MNHEWTQEIEDDTEYLPSSQARLIYIAENGDKAAKSDED